MSDESWQQDLRFLEMNSRNDERGVKRIEQFTNDERIKSLA